MYRARLDYAEHRTELTRRRTELKGLEDLVTETSRQTTEAKRVGYVMAKSSRAADRNRVQVRHRAIRRRDIVQVREPDRSEGSSVTPGCTQMPTGSNRSKFSSWLRKRPAGFESENNPSDVAILNMAVDSRSVFRRSAPGLLPRGERKHHDDLFQGLLSQANRELASLLRDVRTEAHGASLGGTRNQEAGELLMRAIRCAAKQYMLQAELGNLAVTDELTGLYNRRGFMALAERQLKLGRRSGREMLLFVMDVDRMKHINDSFGHLEGDRALKRTAEILEQTFRDSDVVARLGGDEFGVLVIEASGHSEATIKARLFECLKSNCPEEFPYQLSLSLGLARFDSCSRISVGALMAKADQAMYEHKKRRPSSSMNF